MSAPELQDFLADRAAQLDAFSGRDQFTLSAKFLTRHSKEIVPLIGKIVSEPAFRPEEVTRAKNEQVATIREREDQPLGSSSATSSPSSSRTTPTPTTTSACRTRSWPTRPSRSASSGRSSDRGRGSSRCAGRSTSRPVAELIRTLGKYKPAAAPAIAGTGLVDGEGEGAHAGRAQPGPPAGHLPHTRPGRGRGHSRD
jgi:hypothetical protein